MKKNLPAAGRCSRNKELEWLLQSLQPNYHTIADFGKVHAQPLQCMFKLYVQFLSEAGLLSKTTIGIDGSKFKAVNSKKNNFNQKKIDKHHQFIEDIKLPDEYDNPNWSHQMKTWLSEINWKYSSASLALQSRLKQLDFLWYEVLDISTALRAYCRKHHKKDYYLLKSVPGIGGITAAGILAELSDIRRFNRLDDLAAIVGLVPGIYQSSDNKICLGLSKEVTVISEACW